MHVPDVWKLRWGKDLTFSGHRKKYYLPTTLNSPLDFRAAKKKKKNCFFNCETCCVPRVYAKQWHLGGLFSVGISI